MKDKKSKEVRAKSIWYVKRHWSYIPVNAMGWLTYIPFTAYMIGTLMAVAENTDSITGAFFDAFPYWVCGVVIMHWLASHKS